MKRCKEILDRFTMLENQEMIDHFKTRTDNHRLNVLDFLEKALKLNLISQDDFDLHSNHDASKYKEPEYTPYLHISWKYKLAREGKKYNPSKDILDQMVIASFHHVTNNSHHPEYWDDNWTLDKDAHNPDDRDKPRSSIVDATKMPDDAIVAMCCDWCGMSREVGGTPMEWANKNVNVKWKFTDNQVKLINDTINKLWSK